MWSSPANQKSVLRYIIYFQAELPPPSGHNTEEEYVKKSLGFGFFPFFSERIQEVFEKGYSISLV